MIFTNSDVKTHLYRIPVAAESEICLLGGWVLDPSLVAELSSIHSRLAMGARLKAETIILMKQLLINSLTL